MERNGNGVATGTILLVAGALLGAGIALLLAPQSGKQTRKDIARYAKKAKRRAEGVVEEFAQSVSGMVDEVGDRAAGILDSGKDLALDAKKEVLHVIEDGQRKLEKHRAKLEKMIA
jgi:gas vesicle protein